jgi:hypothetical protein
MGQSDTTDQSALLVGCVIDATYGVGMLIEVDERFILLRSGWGLGRPRSLRGRLWIEASVCRPSKVPGVGSIINEWRFDTHLEPGLRRQRFFGCSCAGMVMTEQGQRVSLDPQFAKEWYKCISLRLLARRIVDMEASCPATSGAAFSGGRFCATLSIGKRFRNLDFPLCSWHVHHP